ncbi:MAG: kelch repeat-containing protein [Chitinophagaceae bacterium]
MKNFFSAIIILSSIISTAQVGVNSQWAWMNGSYKQFPDLQNRRSVYGVQGIAAAANTPGAREFSASWKDNSGNLWVMGGAGYVYSTTPYPDNLNDLWKYDPLTNRWTWIMGDTTAGSYGVYGTKGVAAATNKPGSRYRALSWKDGAGNFWLYGGSGRSASSGGTLNDIWKYNPATNMWTWMKGDSTINNTASVFGTKGIAADSVRPYSGIPGAWWTDNSGSLWIYSIGGVSGNDDLWQYNTATNQWVWVKEAASGPRYGTMGVPDATNTPGARGGAATWTDASGNLYLSGSGSRTDLWKFYIGIQQWAWLRGDTIVTPTNVQPIYGTRGISAPANHPGSRFGAITWKDNQGKFWLYGGKKYYGFDTQSDLWKYDPAINEWTWMKGDRSDSIHGSTVYGTQGVAAPANKPGLMAYGVSWVDESGTPWLFGGEDGPSSPTDFSNLLWKLGNQPGPANNTLCPGGGTTLTAAATGSTYQWQINTGSGFVNLANGANYSGVNTITLQLINMPSSFYGYQYQCLVNGVANSNLFKLAFTATYNGAIAGAWENTANWSCGAIPDANTDVVINSGSPVVNSNRSCRSVSLKPATQITVKSGFGLTITGK